MFNPVSKGLVRLSIVFCDLSCLLGLYSEYFPRWLLFRRSRQVGQHIVAILESWFVIQS